MRPYIINLTDYLIRANHFDKITWISEPAAILDHIAVMLRTGEVNEMSPGKLGEILGSFEVGDVPTSQEELLKDLKFAGDCEAFLRSLVSICLAHAILNRLYNKHCMEPFQRKQAKSDTTQYREPDRAELMRLQELHNR
ncbi:MAG: hypothetical protein V4465_03135 [Patescibacteria group bacterium]